MKELVKKWLESKNDVERRKTFVNTQLAETWKNDIQGEKLDEGLLSSRTEKYDCNKITNEILVITAGVDVQKDRLECQIIGWGIGEESWSLDNVILQGNPTLPEVWKDLDGVLARTFFNEKKQELTIAATCVDTGGHHTEQVYNYSKSRSQFKRVFAIKGFSTPNKPIAPAQPNIVGKARNKLFLIGVDTAKEVLYNRLKLTEKGAGYIHFPKRYDEEYFKQLTAEVLVVKYDKGKEKMLWEKQRDRNEALDTFVYALAAIKILKPHFEYIAEEMQQTKNEERKKVKLVKNKDFVNGF